MLATALVMGVLGSAAASPAAAPLDFAVRFAQLLDADPARRIEAAKAIATISGEALERLNARLARPRSTSPELYRRMFLAMWAQVPNWKGPDPMWIVRPEPVWTPPPRLKGRPRPRRPTPHDPENLDWLEALNTLDVSRPDLLEAMPGPPPPDLARPGAEPPLEPPPPVVLTVENVRLARAEAMEAVAILRAIAATKRLDATFPIFRLAFEYDGVFRDECGRQIRTLESYAVPALIRLMYQKGPAALHLGKQRRYASYQLDRMDRARPMKAIAAAPDDRVRTAIVHAYGEERALDAVEAILNQVDAPSHRVRKEARWAWLRYVTGPPPPPAPTRKRKLPGGREEEEEKPDYLTYREIAELALRKQLEAIQGAPPLATATVAELTQQLFDYYDQKHAAEWNHEFEEAKQKETAGDWKGATDEYGFILSHDPNYQRRGEMAPAFAQRGEELKVAGQISEALGFYRQAIDLAPHGPEAAHAEARVALLDGLEALALGRPDPGLFRRALAIDPSLTEARRGLWRASSARVWRGIVEVGEAALALAILGVVLRLLWRRTVPTARSRS